MIVDANLVGFAILLHVRDIKVISVSTDFRASLGLTILDAVFILFEPKHYK